MICGQSIVPTRQGKPLFCKKKAQTISIFLYSAASGVDNTKFRILIKMYLLHKLTLKVEYCQ